MTRIILARHGETEWNVKEIFRGRADIELNDTGRKQIELLGEYLGDQPIEAVYSSPLKRAVNTAEAIARHHNLKVEISDGLNDFDYGKWQGLPEGQVKQQYRELWEVWASSPHLARMPGGESLDDVKERALGVVDYVVHKDRGSVVLVTHRVVLKVLICALLGLDNSHFGNIRLDTSAITIFLYEQGRFILFEHNNTCYLQPLHQPLQKDF